MNAQKFTSESISQAYFTHKLITSKMKKFLMAPHWDLRAKEEKRKLSNYFLYNSWHFPNTRRQSSLIRAGVNEINFEEENRWEYEKCQKPFSIISRKKSCNYLLGEIISKGWEHEKIFSSHRKLLYFWKHFY